MNRLPFAGLAAPTRRVPGTRLFVEEVTPLEDRSILSGVTFNRCHEPDSTVAMLVVVPADEGMYPVLSDLQVGEAVHRVGGHVLAGAEQRFRIGVVVADAGPAERGLHIHIAELFQERGCLEGTAVIGMQHQRLLDHPLRQHRTFENAACVVGRLAQEDLPADDLATEDVDDHHQVVVDTIDRSGQPGAIPSP